MCKWKKGQIVTTKVMKPAYYSNYGPNPEQLFRPGMVGIIINPEAAVVTRLYPNAPDTFNLVQFIGDNGDLWRVSLYDREVKKLPDNTLPPVGVYHWQDDIYRIFAVQAWSVNIERDLEASGLRLIQVYSQFTEPYVCYEVQYQPETKLEEEKEEVIHE